MDFTDLFLSCFFRACFCLFIADLCDATVLLLYNSTGCLFNMNNHVLSREKTGKRAKQTLSTPVFFCYSELRNRIRTEGHVPPVPEQHRVQQFPGPLNGRGKRGFALVIGHV